MVEINPDLIVRIATRLYNDIPYTETLPTDSGGIQSSVPEFINSDNITLLEKNVDLTTDRPGSKIEANFKDQEFTLTRIANIIQSSVQNPYEEKTDRSQDYYFLQSFTPSQASSLADHANNLVNEQTYANNDENLTGLKSFVNKIQSCQHKLTGSADPDKRFADPFSELFKSSLPDNPIFTKPGIFDVSAIRKDFPVLNQNIHGKPLVWFDNAATTQKPKSVIAALTKYYTYDNSNIHRGAHTLATRATDAFEQSREKIRRYLNADSASEIIFVRGTTEGVNLVAQSYGRKFIQPGDEIILSVLEHHANIVPWQFIAKEKGATLRVIPVNDRGEILLEDYEKLLGPRTKLVALTHASNSLGTVLPVAHMIQMARRYGARVLIDGAQSVAHMPVDVQLLDCDFYVFSGHKIFGPTGIGALYGRKELLEIMPPWQGGGNMIRNVTFEETTFNDIPAKFEAGTPNVADAIGLGVALDYVNSVGLENIAGHERKLLDYATEQLSHIKGLRLIGNAREKVSVLSFILDNKPTEEVGRLLDQEGIAVRAGHHCAQPSLRRYGLNATVRSSLAFYNTFDEIDRLTAAVKRIGLL